MIELQPLTTSDVLYFWLEQKIGASTSQKPKGYQKRSTGQNTRQETRIMCASVVESLPMYDICKERLKDYLQSPGLPKGLLIEFLTVLEESLKANPIYPVMPDADGARILATYMTIHEVADEIGVSSHAVSCRLSKMQTSLPFGSYSFERVWYINPLDVETIQSIALIRKKVKKVATLGVAIA